MKKQIKMLWEKVKNYIKYLIQNPKQLLLPFIIAEVIFWIPVWIPILLGFIISPWWWGIAGTVILFWAGPFTPAIPLQIGLIALFERLFNKNKIKEKKKDGRRNRKNK